MKKARKWLLYELFDVFWIEPSSGEGKFFEPLEEVLGIIEAIVNDADFES